MRWLAWSVVLWLAWPVAQATAQLQLGGTGAEPIEIEATESLEWHSEEKIYIARGDARVRRGEFEVRADLLTAYYRELPEGGTEIWRLTGDGSVVVADAEQRARGDHGDYDVDRDVFVLTGGDLLFETPTETVTARDSLEYWQSEGIAVARGDALAVRDGDRIRAEILTAEFVEDAAGNRQLSTINGVGDVVITSGDDIAMADEGIYNTADDVATLYGSVRLNRGKSQLNGDYAEFNLTTGVSRLLARPEGDGRVRGLLIPTQ